MLLKPVVGTAAFLSSLKLPTNKASERMFVCGGNTGPKVLFSFEIIAMESPPKFGWDMGPFGFPKGSNKIDIVDRSRTLR